MKRRIANLTSAVLSPFVVSLAAILLLSFESTAVDDALRWSGVMAAASVLPVFLLVIFQRRAGRIEGVLNATRRQRRAIYLLAMACTAVGYASLVHWQAPALLQAAFVGGFSGAVLFMVINLVWKISLHSGFVGALAAMLVMLCGCDGSRGWVAAAAVVVPVLLTAWSRVELKQHSVLEVAAGAVLGGLVLAAAFGVSGLP